MGKCSPIFVAVDDNTYDPLIISSSDASFSCQRRAISGNTSIRQKKSLAGQFIVDATREESKNLVRSFKEMNETSKAIQERIMEIEMKLHTKTSKRQMTSQINMIGCTKPEHHRGRHGHHGGSKKEKKYYRYIVDVCKKQKQ